MPHFAALLTARIPRIWIALCAPLALVGILHAQAPTIPAVPATPGYIAVVAGTQTTGHAGDGSLATATGVKMTNPDGLVLDSNGNLYISEYNTVGVGGYVRMVNAQTGVISTYAGNSLGSNTSPNGGAATSYALTGVQALAIDSANNIYVADSAHYVIDKISSVDQTMSAIAGTYLAQGSSDGPAASASFRSTAGLAVDPSGNVYISDQGSDALRMLYEGGAVPAALSAVTSSPQVGNVYTIAGLAQTPCTTHPCGDGGPANQARFGVGALNALSLDSGGNLYISDKGADDVVRVIYQSGAAAACLIEIENPALFGLSAGATSCAGATSSPTPGSIYTIAGTQAATCTAAPCGDGGLATSAHFSNIIVGVVVDPAGNVLINDSSDFSVRILYAGGTVPPALQAITSSPTPGYIYTIAGVSKASGFTGFPGPAAAAKVKSAYGLVLDPHGNLFIADAANFDVYAVAGGGAVPLTAQTITFPAPTPVTYGVTPFTLTGATASSALPVTYSVVSGPATLSSGTLTITGAGPVVIEADQAGDSTYAAAKPVQQTLTVNPAVLSVTADDKTMAQGGTLPSFTYTVQGFVNGDTQAAALTGSPAFSTTANSSSAAGDYPITISNNGGTLAATSNPANYTFHFVNGTLHVAAKTTQTITFNQIPNQVYGNPSINLNSYFSVDSGLALTYTTSSTNASISGNSLTITGSGMVIVHADQAGNGAYTAATQVSQMFNVAAAGLTVTANNQSRPFGQANPALTYAVTGFVNGDTQAAATSGSPTLSTSATTSSPVGNYDITIGAGSFAAPNYSPAFVKGTLTVSGNATQTITFGALPAVTYGVTPITLSATASSGLPITYTVTGPAIVSGSILTITGIGTVNVTATQLGNDNYAAAAAVSRSFPVNPATLTLTANTQTVTVGSPIPSLTYSVTGLVNGDTQATATTGAPSLSTTATSSSGVGAYPIAITQGTLASTNYTFSFTSGTLNIINKTAQTITFGALSSTTYGAGSVTLMATASSGVPVTYSVAGPASVSGSLLTITGAGTVTVTANQTGNATYLAATPVSQSFVVAPAVLTVTASNASRAFGAANPNFAYTITGFVNGDAQATATTGAPSLSTTATSTSGAGTYPISAAQGTLAAANYTFAFVSGTLTVTTTTNVITFPAIPVSSQTYGAVIPLSATASSGLPVTYTVTGNATVSGSTLTITGIGPVTVTAAQAGNANYAAATSVSQAFTAKQATLTVMVGYYTRPQGAVNPTFTATITGFVNGDANTPLVLTGAPIITTLATPASAPGTYAITPALGTLFAANYTFAFVPGVLTVTDAPSYTIIPSPSALTIPLGQSRQSGLQVVSSNNYTGSVTFSCGQVPPGITCTFSPATVTVTPNQGASGQVNVSTLTVSTMTGASAQLRTNGSNTALAGIFLLPGGLVGLFLAFQRKRIAGNVRVRQLLFVFVMLAAVMGLGGCGSSNTLGVAPMGNTTLLITATGTGAPGTGSQNMTNILYLTVNVTSLQ